MPKVAKKRDAADAVHPYKKPKFAFGSPKKAGKAEQAANTPGTATKAPSSGEGGMRVPSLQASNANVKQKRFNNFRKWTPESMANYLEHTVEEKDGKKVAKLGKLVKSKAWVNKRGEEVKPKQPWKLDQYGKDGLYFDGLMKVYQVYNNTDTPGNTSKLTFRAHFVTEEGQIDEEAMLNFKSFVDSFQQWAYENRDNLPWQWSKGAKNIAKKLKEIAQETNNATFEQIMTDPKYQKYKTSTNEETGEDNYLNWDKEEIGLVVDGEAPPEGAVVIGNKFFSNRVKKNRAGLYYVEFDMNLDKYSDIQDASKKNKSISLTDITEGSIVRTRGVQTLYALNEQQIVGGVPKIPMGRDPQLVVMYINPDGRNIQPDRKSAQGAGSDGEGGSSSTNNYAAYQEQQNIDVAARIAASMGIRVPSA